jgi:hypothetical protein
MRCDTCRITMRSDLCLLYQSRARGTAPLRDVQVNGGPKGILVIWAQKYQPCLTCVTGKEIREGKGCDMDVEQLKKIKSGESGFPAANDFRNEPNICDMCFESNQQMNTPIPPPAPATLIVDTIPPGGKSEITEKPILRTCERCGWTGSEDDFHIAGQTGRINVCRKCIVVARQKNKANREAGLTELGPLAVVLDFSDYPELLETIQADARRNFRTLANEILYRVCNG